MPTSVTSPIYRTRSFIDWAAQIFVTLNFPANAESAEFTFSMATRHSVDIGNAAAELATSPPWCSRFKRSSFQANFKTNLRRLLLLVGKVSFSPLYLTNKILEYQMCFDISTVIVSFRLETCRAAEAPSNYLFYFILLYWQLAISTLDYIHGYGRRFDEHHYHIRQGDDGDASLSRHHHQQAQRPQY